MKSIGPDWVKKFFLGQCTPKEAEKVLEWFRTPEGRRYLEEHIDQNISRRLRSETADERKTADSEKIFKEIQNRIRQKDDEKKKTEAGRIVRKMHGKRREGIVAKLAAAVVIFGFLLAGYWWLEQREMTRTTGEPTYVEHSTGQEQQKLLTLSDGTSVRLHENSTIAVPETYNEDNRHIQLTGEALFDVEHNPDLPFEIDADEGLVRVLGTKFNVKIDPRRQHVQVAVLEGKVTLSGNEGEGNSAALLTEGYFGVYNFDTRETTIEEAPVHNYISWINGELEFRGTPLWKISRQLGWMYGTSFQYTGEHLRDLKLDAHMPADTLDEVLNIIASTLEITYRKERDTVVWMD